MKKKIWLFWVVFTLFLLVACGEKQEEDPNKMSVYYVSSTETKIEAHDYSLQAAEAEAKVEELLAVLGTSPIKKEYKPPLTFGFQVLDYRLADGKLLLNMDENYRAMTVTQEVLVRAAIVRTLTQLPEVNFVAFRVNNEQLYDSLGKMVGWMNADQFIENEGNEINTYEEVTLKLYFANEAGDGLIVTNRTKEYNTNISLEKLVVEELIKGPNADGVYPTINPDTKVANVMVKDNICYVNLDENFLTQVYAVTADVTIYSIVNSLIEIPNVNKVQILINGETGVLYREKFDLTAYYERNLDIVTTIE